MCTLADRISTHILSLTSTALSEWEKVGLFVYEYAVWPEGSRSSRSRLRHAYKRGCGRASIIITQTNLYSTRT